VGSSENLRTHRVILSVCSTFFKKMFRQQEAQLTQTQNPYIFLKGVTHNDLTSLMDFMYQGEVNVADKDLDAFLSISEELEVEGLQNTRDKGRVYLDKSLNEDSKPNNFGLKRKLSMNKSMSNFKSFAETMLPHLAVDEDEGIALPNDLAIDITDDPVSSWKSQLTPQLEGYSSVGKYADHYFKVEGEEKMFQCKLCSHTGRTTQIIKDHISLEHFPKDVPCEVCGTVLRGDGPLRNHMYACARKAGKKFTMKKEKE